MKKAILLILLSGWLAGGLTAQKYVTREGAISFYSNAPLEKIEAHNQKVMAVLDAASGRLEFAVLIKAFQFEKALMQEHFNENYMESSKFPKAVFKGRLADAAAVNYKKDGTYPAKVSGELTIHGKTQSVETDAQIVVKGETLKATASFEVAVADYDIQIPAVVRDNIAKNVRIDVDAELKPLDEKTSQ